RGGHSRHASDVSVALPDTEQGAGEVVDPLTRVAGARTWLRWLSDLISHPRARIAAFGSVLLGGFALGAVALFGFAWLANEVLEQATAALDQQVLQAMRRFASPQLDAAARALSFMGSEAVLVFGTVLLAYLAWRGRWGAAAMLVLVVFGAQLLNDLL